MSPKEWHFPEALQRGEFPFLDLLGIEVGEIESGKAILHLDVEEKHLRSLGMVHGGVTSTLLDSALGIAGASQAPDHHHAVTMQLNVNFTKTAKQGDHLTTTGRCVHHGTKTAVCHGETTDQEGKIVATATSTLMFLPLEREDSE